MNDKVISLQRYESYLQEFVGQSLSEFYYIIDRTVVFEAGKRYQVGESTVRGETIPSYKSEYELWLDGDWDYKKDGQIIQSTAVRPGEDSHMFRKRIGDFIEGINPKKVTAITVSDDGKQAVLSLDIGGQFVVKADGYQFVNYPRCEFSKEGQLVSIHQTQPNPSGVLIHTDVESSPIV